MCLPLTTTLVTIPGVSGLHKSQIERGILGLDLISAQAWRGTQTNSQNSSGAVSMGGLRPPKPPTPGRPLPRPPGGQNIKKTRKLP